MHGLMITMKSNKTYDFDEYEIYLVNLRCQLLEKVDLQRLHSEFEKASPLLFVKNSNDCQMNMFKAIDMCSERHFWISKQPITNRDENKPNQEKHTSTCISSFCDLQNILKVMKSVANFTQANNKPTLKRIVTR